MFLLRLVWTFFDFVKYTLHYLFSNYRLVISLGGRKAAILAARELHNKELSLGKFYLGPYSLKLVEIAINLALYSFKSLIHTFFSYISLTKSSFYFLTISILYFN